MRIFIFRIFTGKNLFFTAMKHIFRIFTGVLPDYFLLNSASTQNLRESLANFNVQKEKKCI
jgi:hypothetical protein